MAPAAPLLLGAVLDGTGRLGLADWAGVAGAADRAGLDLVTLGDDLAHGPDAAVVLTALAGRTEGVGLVPTITTTHTEPFHVATVLATLDHASHGRAGWLVSVSTDEPAATAVGRRPVPATEDAWVEAGEVIDVARALWDSWDDDAVVRDVVNGRYLDRERVHHIRHEGRFHRVMGPAITPRPPQGHLPVVVTADGAEALAVAATHADVVVVNAVDGDLASRAVDEATARVVESGRDPEDVRILVRLDVRRRPVGDLAGLLESWWSAGVPGLLVEGVDLDELADDVVPRLRARGVRPPARTGVTLRDHLGLSRPASRSAA